MFHGNPFLVIIVQISNRPTKKRCEVCSKLTKSPEQRQGRRSVVFVKFEHIPHLRLGFLLLTLKSKC